MVKLGNVDNLRPCEHKLTKEENSRGGKRSAQVKKEKKTIQKILNDFLNTKAKDNSQFAKLADKLGVTDKESIKDIFTMVCVLNTVKNGDLSDLERIAKLLGENPQMANTEKENQTQLLDAIEKAVRDAD